MCGDYGMQFFFCTTGVTMILLGIACVVFIIDRFARLMRTMCKDFTNELKQDAFRSVTENQKKIMPVNNEEEG